MSDIGLTHIALPVSDVDRTIEFYSKYAGMQVVHRRIDPKAGVAVVWISDRTRPFVIVLANSKRFRTSRSVSLGTPGSWLQKPRIYGRSLRQSTSRRGIA
ncbi:VOC family protein [Microcoleus sp. Pol12B4]|uniref:VOC family protein n=1 Tax=Microcoleus sp. Pol12B4 TaxID=3055395 RepID=UPI002FD2E492